MSKLTLDVELAGRVVTIEAESEVSLMRSWWILSQMNEEAEKLFGEGASGVSPFVFEDEGGEIGYGFEDTSDQDHTVVFDTDRRTGELLPQGVEPLGPKEPSNGKMPPPE